MVLRSTMICALLAVAGDRTVADGIRAKRVRRSTIAINNHKGAATAAAVVEVVAAAATEAAAERAAAEKSTAEKAAAEKAEGSAEKFSSWAPRQPWFSEVLVTHPESQAPLADGPPLTPQMPSRSMPFGARNFDIEAPSAFGRPNYANPLSNGEMSAFGSPTSEVLVTHPESQAALADGPPLTPQMPSGSVVSEAPPRARNFDIEALSDLARNPSSDGPGFVLPPDVRPFGCNAQILSSSELQNMKVAIIIPYRNEPWPHMEQSVKSILYYTPLDLIEQILFVSDGNNVEAAHVADLKKLSNLISVLEFHQTVGLIYAKSEAVAKAAKSSVLVFLEPHIRVNREWLQPLLFRLKQHPRALVMPSIDIISQDNFDQYHQGDKGHWRFEWNLNLVFTTPDGDFGSSNEPFPSPATSGGIFAIRRDWWDHLGFYDEGMIGWGGDHLEASMKVWRCGGRIEIVPCSRIGHRFRDPQHRPYDVSTEQVVLNYGRIARIWLDEHIETFFRMKSEVRTMRLGDISVQQEQRQRLQCHNMSWYLHNIDHEMQWEETHVCVPGCNVPGLCCEGGAQAAPGRSTIDHVMPEEAYKQAVERAKSFAPDDVDIDGSLNYANPSSNGANDEKMRVEIPFDETEFEMAQSVLDSFLEAWPEDAALAWMQKNVAKASTAVHNAREEVAKAQAAQSLATRLTQRVEADERVHKASETLAVATSQAAIAASEAKIAVNIAKQRLVRTVEGVKETVKELEEDARRGEGPWRINFDKAAKELQMAKDRETLLEVALKKVSQASVDFVKVEPAADKVISRWDGYPSPQIYFTIEDPNDRF